MFLLYDLLTLLSVLVLVPYYLGKRAFGRKSRQGLRERLGLQSPERWRRMNGRQVIWVHAVSVGETRAAIPLLRALKERFPDHLLLLSNVTETGRATAETIPQVDAHLFFPVDLSWIMQRAMRLIRPRLVVIVETEIWPNFVRSAAKSGVPVALVNGRISDRSYPRYRFFRPVLKPLLQQIDAFCMQSAQDVERIIDLGAPPERVALTGNVKFDMVSPLAADETQDALRIRYHLPNALPVLVAGSTHAGEETQLLSVYQRLLQQGRQMILVLVPRHPDRCQAIADELAQAGVTVQRRSQLDEASPMLAAGDVLLVDTLGEMLRLYAAADLVFVGGSLVPTGGHNVLEASLMRRPVLFGPYMHNFREIAALLETSGGGRSVRDAEDLLANLTALLDSPDVARAMGENGYTLVGSNAGATARTLATLETLLQVRDAG